MGTIRHRDRKTRLGFSRAGDGTSDTAGAAVLCGNFYKPSPLLRTIQFQGARPLTRRENSSRARRRRLRERGRYRPVPILLRSGSAARHFRRVAGFPRADPKAHPRKRTAHRERKMKRKTRGKTISRSVADGRDLLCPGAGILTRFPFG